MSAPKNLFAQIADDWRTHGRDWTKPGFRTMAVYRFGNWRMGLSPVLLRAPFSMLYRMAYRHCRNVYGIELPYSAKVGRGVIIEHQGGIVIHGNTIIGDRCIIRQNCTLGLRSLDALDAAPILDDDVHLGAGAVVVGRVIIGAGAMIGANAVVLNDVPPGALAVGVPARIVAARDADASKG